MFNWIFKILSFILPRKKTPQPIVRENMIIFMCEDQNGNPVIHPFYDGEKMIYPDNKGVFKCK